MRTGVGCCGIRLGLIRLVQPALKLVSVIVAMAVKGLKQHPVSFPKEPMRCEIAIQGNLELNIVPGGTRPGRGKNHVIRIVCSFPAPLGKFDVDLVGPIRAKVGSRILKQP